MIVTNRNELVSVCKEVSLFDAQEIINKLIQELLQSKTGVGLAANQIGIDARVCIIRFRDPINLVNPVIIESFDLMEFYNEGCLSFPDEFITTARFNEIFVKDSIRPSGMVLTGFEAVAVQHEIDHLNGITMHDHEIQIPGTNAKCWCGKSKYKKCHKGMAIFS